MDGPIFLDTETTGVPATGNEALSVAIIDYAGNVLLDTLVRPVQHTSWPDAQRIHGIRPADVLQDGVPTLAELTPRIADLVRGRELVIYNAAYDTKILADALALGPPASVKCAMVPFSELIGDWSDFHGNYRFQKLTRAAAHVGHVWRGKAHGALPDCFAARDVWAWLTDPAERARLDAQRREREDAEHVAWHVNDLLRRLADREERARELLHRVVERTLTLRIGLRHFDLMRDLLDAEQSADVFCRHQTGYPVRIWNDWGEQLLSLPRYVYGRDAVPAGLVWNARVHLLPAIKDVPPAALLVTVWGPGELFEKWAGACKLYQLEALKRGLHYVPYTDDYVDGYCSLTALTRDHKVPKSQAQQVRPAYMKRSRKYDPYLLYPIPKKDDAKITLLDSIPVLAEGTPD